MRAVLVSMKSFFSAEPLMIEPTESEAREELDRFVGALKTISEEARSDPDRVCAAPRATAISRLDETKASREPILSWRMYKEQMKG